MRRGWRRVALVLIALLLVLGVAGGGAAWWVGMRPLPPTRGTLRVAGLTAPVTVLRDSWGVPHIFAQNTPDLLRAQGYLQAGDRLWQMEFQRRVGLGRLSEVLGEATLSTDKFLRTLGIRQAAQADWDAMDPELRGYLEAYSQGVNAYLDAHQGNLPIEFTLLGVTPEPWTPLDSLVWGKMMAWDLGGNWETELLRARLVALLGPEAAADLLPDYPDGAPLIVPDDARSYRALGQPDTVALAADLGRFLSPVREGLGSNNWVVAGRKTAGGKPLLANDPHLGIRLPSIWWEVGLHGGGFDVVGASLLGVPGVIIGHNNRIAWGITNVGPDVQDLYLERVRGLTGATPEYEYQGRWLPLAVRTETIGVKGKPDQTLRVLSTRHGPLVNFVVSGLEQPVAFQWTATNEPSQLFRAVANVDRAQDFEQFRAALRDFAVPAQNFVYADVDGNIGYQMPGRIPRRARGQGLVPVPGWTGEYEWTGYIPYDELPTSLNPPEGYIATANNKVVSDGYPYFISAEFAAPYRVRRIAETLAAGTRLTPDDMQALQGDTLNLFNQDLARLILTVQPQGWLQQQALQTLAAWDGRMDPDSAGGSLVEATYLEALKLAVGDEVPPALLDSYLSQSNLHHVFMARLLAQPASPWWDDKGTPGRETRDGLLTTAFGRAVDSLGRQFGDVPTEWKWGRLHTATFRHQPLGESGIALLERVFNRGPIPARGSGFTVNAASFNYRQPYALSSLASYRQVINLADWRDSWSMHTTGQSGQLFSPHYSDMIGPWQRVEYHRMLYTEADLRAARADELTLTP